MQAKDAACFAVGMPAITAMIARPDSPGDIAGQVTYEGTPAKMEPIDMSRDPSCADMYTTPPSAETVVIGSGNRLANVLVYVSAGALDDAVPSTAAVFSQKGCRYIPHVLAFQINQELRIQNQDPTSHNIHPAPKFNREWVKIAAAGHSSYRREIPQGGDLPGQVQRASVDAWHFRRDEELALLRHRR